MGIFIQAIGIVAMVFNILSYQTKTATKIIFMQFISAILFVANFYLLGAYTGAMLNVFAVIRALYLFKVKKPPKYAYAISYIIICVMYALTFILFNKPFTLINAFIELLPTAAMIVQTTAFFLNDANKIRLLSYFVSPCWLAYNSINFSLGGIICESFALISITISLIRFKKQK